MKILALLQSDNRIWHSFFLASVIYGFLVFGIFYAKESFIPKDVGLQNENIAISLNRFIADTPQIQSPDISSPPPPISKPLKKIKKPLPKKVKPKHFPKEKVVQRVEKLEPQIETFNAHLDSINPIFTNPTPPMLIFGKNNDPFLVAIKQAIDKNLHYPRNARMMRVEGIVTIEFTLLAGGGVQNVRVIDSSGSPILDKAAIRIVFDAEDSFPSTQNNVIIQIPIQYSLNG